MPAILKLVVGILLLDYTLYAWHWMNHRIPLLWRFHSAHHVDLDLDVSTAARFHFGELVFSAGFHSLQVLLIGVDPAALALFELLVTAAALLHHANVRLPERFEQRLQWLVVTPRMHGIHHSIVREETDSNFSTILSCWDRLHRTLCLNIPQSEITIGIPSYRDPSELTLWGSLMVPFRRPRPWALSSGEVPRR